MFSCEITSCAVLFQSTSPCGGRLSLDKEIIKTGFISIHVPLRGTTIKSGVSILRFFISIHVPLRGTTHCRPHTRLWTIFQSTSPCGGRPLPLKFFLLLPSISIHVPLRGTTKLSLTKTVSLEFQSTSPCGGRHFLPALPGITKAISIHVPLRGTTKAFMFYIPFPSNFNPRPLAGDDGVREQHKSRPAYNFNPRPLAGDD